MFKNKEYFLVYVFLCGKKCRLIYVINTRTIGLKHTFVHSFKHYFITHLNWYNVMSFLFYKELYQFGSIQTLERQVMFIYIIFNNAVNNWNR